MEAPICFSQYFSNKQNVRSYSNIVKPSVWKGEDSVFYKNVLQDDFVVSALSSDLKTILTELKSNLKLKSKEDFKNYFPVDNILHLHSVDKEYILTNSWKGMCEIIPKNLFGTSRNNKILKNIIRDAVYSMKRQHFIIEQNIAKWDFSIFPWNYIPNISKSCLVNIIKWICKSVLAPMICLNFYVTACKIDANENKLYYFWKHQWQSFYDKKVSNMIFTKAIKKCVPYSLGKKIKRIHDCTERKKLKALRRDIPKLYLILKPNNECRPIVRYKSDTRAEKYKVKDRLKFLRLLVGRPFSKIESQYSDIYSEWVKADKPKLYFVKTDLSNAFGSINKEKLMKILSERHMNFQKNEKCGYLKKKVAQQYKDMIIELRKPLLIRAGSTVYEWMEGLVQGYKYSPVLSELYYTHLDELYFANHLKRLDNQMQLFIRVVDDYLYISNSLEDALSFLEALTNYRNVNYEKTVVNFPHEKIKCSEEMTFLGYSYNTCNMQVGRASNVYTGQMCYKIAFTSALSNLNKFLQNRIGQSGIQINTHIFNMQHNSEELIWKHVFTTFCLSANKFCTILAVLCNDKEMNDYLAIYKKRVSVKLTNSMLETLLKSKPTNFMFMYCINHFRYLSWVALYLCAKGTSKCSGLVQRINDEIAKSNCVFGKWREHACRIDTNGESRRTAIKEICRRHDLRQFFKGFDKLPSGFECYNHKRLM